MKTLLERLRPFLLTGALVGQIVLVTACGGGSSGSSSTPPNSTGPGVPATGQTVSYHDFDDGYYAEPAASRFVDNGDGTVTDHATNLRWQKCLVGQTGSGCSGSEQLINWYAASGTYDATSNPSTADACAGYGAGWRLPNRFELQSITNYGASSPAAFVTYFPTTTAYLWSGTSDASGTNAWIVIAAYGTNGINAKATATPSARCVQGTPLVSAGYHANGDGTVTDLASGLMWQQCPAGLSGSECLTGSVFRPGWSNATAIDAVNYCRLLVLGGQADWRLPNVKELQSLVDPSTGSPTINATVFPNTATAGGTTRYWSSTTYAADTTVAWVVDFSYGGDFGHDKTAYANQVRCVRGP